MLKADHDKVKGLLSDLESTTERGVKTRGLDVSDPTWGAKAIVTKENIEHHIEEEAREMFPQARRVFDREELQDLGDRMAERKVSAGREPGVPISG